MNIVLYQIIPELDYSRLMFDNYKRTMKRCRGKIYAKLYEIAYSGVLDVDTPGDVYRIFNIDLPDGYRGRSMSVSDIVEFRYSAEKSVFYFCDSVGFKEIEFETIDNPDKVQKQDFLSKPLVVVSKCLEDFPRELLCVDCGENTRMRYGAHSDENLGIVGTWLMRKGFDYDLLK